MGSSMATNLEVLSDHRTSLDKTVAYFILVIVGGQILLPISLWTLTSSKNTRRHPTLHMFLLSWVFFSVSACFLLYTGHGMSANPPYALCVVQVGLINATYWMIGFSGVSLVLQLWFTLPSTNGSTRESRLRELLLLIVPPSAAVVYLVVFLATSRVSQSATAVERGRLTCRFQDRPSTEFFARLTPIVTAILVLCCFFFSTRMLYTTVQCLSEIRGWRLKDTLQSPDRGGPWLKILTRVTMFIAWLIPTLAASLIDAVTPQSPVHYLVDMYIALLPLAAFCIFGTLPGVRKDHTERPPQIDTCTGATTGGFLNITVMTESCTVSSGPPVESQV
ncbi:hypothetical protein EXIGLDRAFT_782642 [Exidia glandulosa HHB12029]|uniref:G-protein coupled receptors family 1 profile domain-containing protein n=1 Tax=Exidia glandulosa HHB12029 TaxID=1314781 RepID=A0A166NIS6_EXIGL|nr:hypothetical protein EXIGLDRAFT_782642 [Exidia glandulosa HHB12029]